MKSQPCSITAHKLCSASSLRLVQNLSTTVKTIEHASPVSDMMNLALATLRSVVRPRTVAAASAEFCLEDPTRLLECGNQAEKGQEQPDGDKQGRDLPSHPGFETEILTVEEDPGSYGIAQNSRGGLWVGERSR